MSELRRILQSLLFVCALSCTLSGCSTLNLFGSKQLPFGAASVEAPKTPPAKFVVEKHSKFGAPKTFEGTLSDQLTVQSALKAAGVRRIGRGMKIEVYRRVADTGRVIKLPVEYDARKKAVKMEQDYAIHPNDRIVIRQNSNSGLDKAVSKIFGDL